MNKENAKFLYSQMRKVARMAPDLPDELQDALYNLLQEAVEYGQNSMAEYIIAKAREATTSGYTFD